VKDLRRSKCRLRSSSTEYVDATQGPANEASQIEIINDSRTLRKVWAGTGVATSLRRFERLVQLVNPRAIERSTRVSKG
jgi:hypothetical protein